MQTHLVEIVPDKVEAEESWSDWAARNVKENGWKAAGAAAIAAPVIPAGIGAVAVGAGLVSGIQNGVAWWRGSDGIQELEIGKASHLHDEQGRPICVNQTYAFHPNESNANIVILASDFHKVIVAEQIADIVTYIRGVVRAVTINIEVESERSGNLDGSFLSRFSFGGEVASKKRHSVELQYDEPEIVPIKVEPFWLRVFPEIIAAFKDARKGTIKRSVVVDTSFGLNASDAKQAGIEASWLGRQRFDIFARFT